QALGELGEALTRENRADAFGDRQLDAQPVREVAEDRRRRQPLDRLADLGDCPLRGQSLRDQLAGVAVARLRAAATHDEVADAGEAGKCFGPPAGGLAQPCPLLEPASDERRLGAVAAPEP